MAGDTITRRDHGKPFDRCTTQEHVIHLDPFQGYVIEMEDEHFHHDSAVLLPDYGHKADPSRLCGLAVLAHCLEHAAKYKTQKLLIVGHTDTTGSNQYNLGLSEKRALSVLHALTGDQNAWVGVTKSKNKVEDYQQILKWACNVLAFDCDPGKVDNVLGPKTKAATKKFQEQYNKDYKTNIPENGVVGDDTWGAFFNLYQEVLKQMLGADDTKMKALRGALKWVDGGKKTVGCGEEFPIDSPRKNNYRSKINRRVEILYFDPGQEPKLDCHGGPGSCNAILCEVYNPKMYKYTHITPPPIPVVVPLYDIQNVRTVIRIAPEKETVQIQYDIINVGHLIRSGTWRILRKSDNKVLKTTALTADQWTAGPHSIDWNGSVDTDGDFPDGFVTLEFSPYVVEVAIDGRLGPKSGTDEIKVELDDFVVEKAPKAHLSDAKDQKIWDKVPDLPAGAPVEVRLLSNLFAIDGAEMNDGTAFTAYQTLWDEGPRIPLRATVTILDSNGQPVRAGKALGRARVLWDFTDPAQDDPPYLATALNPPPATNSSLGAKNFVDNALDYDKTNTKPVDGDNCHLDRGGKRDSSAGGTDIFVAGDGQVTNFPFTVAAGGTRWWGAFSDFEKSGTEEARTGCIFRPSRMAGDNYVVKAYLDLKQALDTADDTPTGAEREVDVGSFEIWREVTLVEHFKKCAQVTQVMPSIVGYYLDAFIRVDDKRGTPTAMTKAQYDAAFTAARPLAKTEVDGWGGGYPLVTKYSLPNVPSQYDAERPPNSVGGSIVKFFETVGEGIASVFGHKATPTPTTWVATFRSYSDFKSKVKSGEGLTNAGLATTLANGGLNTEQAYAEATVAFGKMIGEQMCKAKATKDGITVLQFDWVSSHEEMLGSHQLNGRACNKELTKCGFALYNTDTADDPGVEQTPAHEIGHTMFLPHSPRLRLTGGGGTALVDSGGGIQPDRHDGDNRNCLMSYARPRPGFCGLCLLRLRGWNQDEFDRNGPTQVKA